MEKTSRSIVTQARLSYASQNKWAGFIMLLVAAIAGATWAGVAFHVGYSYGSCPTCDGRPPKDIFFILMVGFACVHPLLAVALYRAWLRRELRRRRRARSPVDVALDHLEAKERAARKAIDARHAETRQMQQEVLDWWQAHKEDPGMTKDKAADEMAEKLVPLKWRTVRDYLKGV